MSTSRRRVDVFEHHRATNSHNKTQTEKLTSLETKQQATNDKIDTLSGAINNNLGDGATKLQTYVYAHDSAGGLARPLKCDTSGRLECSVDALEVTAETINLNTDTLETLQTATKNALFTNPAGSGNTIGENASAINSNIITSNSKLDSIIANTASSSSTGLSTEATLLLAKNALFTDPAGSGNTIGENASAINSNIISLNNKFVGGQTTSGMATAQNQQVIDLTLQGIDGIVGNIETDVAALEVLQTATNSKLDAIVTDAAAIETLNVTANGILGNIATDQAALEVLHTATNSKLDTIDSVLDNAEAHLGNIDNGIDVLEACVGSNKVNVNISSGNISGFATESTLSAAEAHLGNIETAVQLLDNIVSGSEAQVDIVSSALPTGASTEATLANAEAHLGNIDNGIDVLEACVGSNKVNVNISSGNISGFATESTLSAAEAHLGNIETAVQLLDNIVSGSEAQVDIVSSALPTGAATQSTLADAEAHLGNIDTGIDVLEACVGSNKVNVNISSGNISGFATESTLSAAEAHLGNIETAVQLIDDVVKAEDTAHSGGDKGIMSLSVRKDTATNLAGSDADYQPLITDANGRLYVKMATDRTNGSEVTYVSGQAVSGSGGTFTGSAIALSANTNAIFVEHNFSNSAIKYELMVSIDGTNFFGTGVEYNAGGVAPATTTGINTILGTSQFAVSHVPHIKFKFTNGDGSSQNATLSYVIQSS